MITGRIDVKKINKEKLYVGDKGTYLSIVLIPTPDGKYGDYMIVEENEPQGRREPYLGMLRMWAISRVVVQALLQYLQKTCPGDVHTSS